MENRIIKQGNQIYRVLTSKEDMLFVMDCIKPRIPKWIKAETEFDTITEDGLKSALGVAFEELNEIAPNRVKIMNERFTMISGLLPFLQDKEMRGKALESISSEYHISKQTLRRYLCSYLFYMSINRPAIFILFAPYFL